MATGNSKIKPNPIQRTERPANNEDATTNEIAKDDTTQMHFESDAHASDGIEKILDEELQPKRKKRGKSKPTRKAKLVQRLVGPRGLNKILQTFPKKNWGQQINKDNVGKELQKLMWEYAKWAKDVLPTMAFEDAFAFIDSVSQSIPFKSEVHRLRYPEEEAERGDGTTASILLRPDSDYTEEDALQALHPPQPLDDDEVTFDMDEDEPSQQEEQQAAPSSELEEQRHTTETKARSEEEPRDQHEPEAEESSPPHQPKSKLSRLKPNSKSRYNKQKEKETEKEHPKKKRRSAPSDSDDTENDSEDSLSSNASTASETEIDVWSDTRSSLGHLIKNRNRPLVSASSATDTNGDLDPILKGKRMRKTRADQAASTAVVTKESDVYFSKKASKAKTVLPALATTTSSQSSASSYSDPLSGYTMSNKQTHRELNTLMAAPMPMAPTSSLRARLAVAAAKNATSLLSLQSSPVASTSISAVKSSNRDTMLEMVMQSGGSSDSEDEITISGRQQSAFKGAAGQVTHSIEL